MRVLFLIPVLIAGLFGGLAAPRAGEINVVGTGDGLEILRAVAAAYTTEHPGTKILVPPSIGSGGAIAAVGVGRERLGRVARPLTAAETQSGLVSVPIFEIPSAFYVHPGVGEIGLTPAQLAAIFSGKESEWALFGGPPLKIRVVRREEADSTLQVLRAAFPDFRDVKITARSKLALTTQEAIDSIRENAGAIGFGPYSSAAAATMPVVRVDGRRPLDPGYPAIVTLALVYMPERIDDEIRDFIRYFNAQKAQAIIREAGGRPVRR